MSTSGPANNGWTWALTREFEAIHVPTQGWFGQVKAIGAEKPPQILARLVKSPPASKFLASPQAAPGLPRSLGCHG